MAVGATQPEASTEAPTAAAQATELPTAAATPTAPPAPATELAVANALFADDFSQNANGWDEDSTATTARALRGGVYALQVFNAVWFAWAIPATPAAQALTDIHLRVTASSVGGNAPAFGVICSYLNSEAFYFLGFGDDGYYGIARIEGADFILLTGEANAWVRSDAIALFQPAYTLEADCYADGRLRLTVDGVVIAEAQDSAPYGPGGIGLFVQSFDNVPVEVEFDDLVVTPLTQ